MDEIGKQRRWDTAQELYQAAITALGQLRLDAQYRALAVPLEQAQHGIQTAFDVMERVRQHKFGEAS